MLSIFLYLLPIKKEFLCETKTILLHIIISSNILIQPKSFIWIMLGNYTQYIWLKNSFFISFLSIFLWGSWSTFRSISSSISGSMHWRRRCSLFLFIYWWVSRRRRWRRCWRIWFRRRWWGSWRVFLRGRLCSFLLYFAFFRWWLRLSSVSFTLSCCVSPGLFFFLLTWISFSFISAWLRSSRRFRTWT